MGEMFATLTFDVLAGCADGVDQDYGPSDGEQKDNVYDENKK
jgi:hypothetical protein